MMMNLNFPNCIKVAELDCSSGQNAFLAISEIINTISVLCQQSNQNPPEIDCCLNDLPENDFNATFKSIPFFNKELMITNQASCFVYGAPGFSDLEDVWDDLPVSRLKYNALDDFQEDFQEVFQTTSRRSSGLLGSLPDDLQEVVWTSWKSSDRVFSHVSPFHNKPERFGFSDLEDFWDDLPVSRLKYNALDDFQKVFHTTSRKFSIRLPGSLPDDFQEVFFHIKWSSSLSL
uniref:Uncharacterized protein n=1 Tax=Brassica oleracea var. oleracea TaxID=109376 RepID=A0A0D3CL63_BRAOL